MTPAAHTKLFVSIDDARREMFERANGGQPQRCPCCSRYVKIYHRKLNSSMARALRILRRMDRDEPGRWVHLQREVVPGRGSWVVQATLLAHWGFLSRWTKENGAPEAGHYRITDVGKSFVDGTLDAPHAGYFYNDELLGWDETARTTIHKALGDKFLYEEI